MNREECLELDAKDTLGRYRDEFVVPEGTIYLDGNSLGLMPKSVPARVAHVMGKEWAQDTITSWNRNGWWQMSRKVGDKIAPLIGAASGSVVVADTITANLFKVLTASLSMRGERKIILTDSGNFHNDLYVAQGLNALLADGHELKIVEPWHVEPAITEDVAVVMLTETDYRSARRHNMKSITAAAHEKGALTVWDLAHSAGALPVELMDCDADFAIGCTYKYLNGGPGAPAFVFVHPRLQAEAMPGLVGWWGHKRPFAFETMFEAADDIARFQSGTQPILSLSALDAAMDVWTDVDMNVVYEKAQVLCCKFAEYAEERCGHHGLSLYGSDDFNWRGSHVCLAHDQSYAIMQALIARKIVGDFRAPNLMRFGFAPLYNRYVDAFDTVEAIADILDNRLWDRPEFLAKKAVT